MLGSSAKVKEKGKRKTWRQWFDPQQGTARRNDATLLELLRKNFEFVEVGEFAAL